MTPPRNSDRRLAVSEALAVMCADVRELGPGRWSFSTRDAALVGTVWVEERWLVMGTGNGNGLIAGKLQGTNAWALLRAEAGLPPTTKIVAGTGRRLRLRSELPLSRDTDLPSEIEGMCRELAEARMVLCGRSKPKGVSREAAASGGPGGNDLLQTCMDAGWPAEMRGDAVAVRLEVPGGFHLAKIEPAWGGYARARVELLASEALGEICRRGVGVFLLRVNGTVRMVRAAAEQDRDEALVMLEAHADPTRQPDVATALGALSVACRIAGEEVVALQDEALAADYLRRYGIPVRKGSGKRTGSAAR